MAVGRQVGRFLPPALSRGGHTTGQFVIFGLGLVCVLGWGDDCVLSKNKSGELRLNLSRS